MRALRRHPLQVAALTVAVGVVVALGVMSLRPEGRASAPVRPVATASATATPDVRVDQVKAVARRFVIALWESAKTGDTKDVDTLAAPDTQGYGNAGVAATISKDAHHNFMASRVDFDESSWQINVSTEQAKVMVSYRLFGHDADWPSLRPREADHETTAYPAEFELALVGQKWLITRFN